MSIRDEILNRCSERRLFALEPAIPGTHFVRAMFLSPELLGFIMGPWNDRNSENRAGRLRADFDMFISGLMISVGKDPYKKKKSAYMSPLDPMADEVWKIRSRDPKPGIRVFGRFAEKDNFIALTWGCREEIGDPGSRAWRDERERCKAEWRKLFPSYDPHSGTTPNEYVSNIILV